jgi:hypothetical protein
MKYGILILMLIAMTCEKEKKCYQCRDLQDKCETWINMCDSSEVVVSKIISSDLWECKLK